MCSRWKRAQDLSRFTVFDTEVQAGSIRGKGTPEESSEWSKRRARGSVAAGLSRIHSLREGRNAGSSEFFDFVSLMGQRVDFYCLPMELLK